MPHPHRAAALSGAVLLALLATVQMPGGIPVGTLAIGKSGAKNAALFAAAIIARKDPNAMREVRVMSHANACGLSKTTGTAATHNSINRPQEGWECVKLQIFPGWFNTSAQATAHSYS